MPRVKKEKANAPVPPPKKNDEVKHGCCSCLHYKKDIKLEPCKSCERWNYWEDAALAK